MISWLSHNFLAFVGHAAGAAFWSAVAAFVLWFLAWWKAKKDGTTIAFLFNNPLELISPSAVGLLLMTVASLTIVIFKQKHKLDKLDNLASFGVRLFSKHDSAAEKKADWDLLRADLASASEEKSALWLLGATGKETFSSVTAPLFDAVRNFEGEIKVLLIRPHSFAFKTRCKGLRMSDAGYLEDILDSISYCKELSAKGKSIELKLYDTLPIWKLVMTTRVLWLQYYKMNRHVDSTPMYSFEFKGEGMTLFDGYRSVFIKRWSHDASHQVDLSKFVRDKWEQFC